MDAPLAQINIHRSLSIVAEPLFYAPSRGSPQSQSAVVAAARLKHESLIRLQRIQSLLNVWTSTSIEVKTHGGSLRRHHFCRYPITAEFVVPTREHVCVLRGNIQRSGMQRIVQEPQSRLQKFFPATARIELRGRGGPEEQIKSVY